MKKINLVVLVVMVAMFLFTSCPSEKPLPQEGTWVCEKPNMVIYIDYESEIYQESGYFGGTYIDRDGEEHQIIVFFDGTRQKMIIKDIYAFTGPGLGISNGEDVTYFDGNYSLSEDGIKMKFKPTMHYKTLRWYWSLTFVLVEE